MAPTTIQPRTAPLLLATCLLADAACAQAKEPVFDGRSVAEWRTLLSSNDLSHTDILIAGGKRALPMLRVLIRSKEPYIPWRAIQACREIGPDAAPLSDDLLAILRDEDDSWIKQQGAMRALYKIGRDDAAFVQQVSRHAIHTDVPALRATCFDVLDALGVDLTLRVLATKNLDEDRAVKLLARIGEPAIPALIASMNGSKRDRRIAEAAAVAIGWPTVTPLESAGFPAVAQEVLQKGAVARVPMQVSVEWSTRDNQPFAQPPVDRVPQMTWWRKRPRSGRLEVFRAKEGPRGLVVEIARMRSKDGEPDLVTCSQVTIPRTRALAAARQFAALAQIRPVQKAMLGSGPLAPEPKLAGLVVRNRDDVILQGRFVGSDTLWNVKDRYVTQAAMVVFEQMLQGYEEQPRHYSNDDRQHQRRLAQREPHLDADLRRLHQAAGKQKD